MHAPRVRLVGLEGRAELVLMLSLDAVEVDRQLLEALVPLGLLRLEGEHGGGGDFEVGHVDFDDGLHHEDADDHEGRCGGGGGDDQNQRGEEQREEEEAGGGERGETGATAGGDTGSGLDVADDGGRAEKGAGDRGERVGEEGATGFGQGAVGGEQPSTFGDADQGADIIEHIDE